MTISKLRFLEAEGLVEPMRAPSGYRKYTVAHVERLRFVLTAQRDRYLPLRVIREQIEALDRGERVVGLPPLPRPDARPAAACRRRRRALPGRSRRRRRRGPSSPTTPG